MNHMNSSLRNYLVNGHMARNKVRVKGIEILRAPDCKYQKSYDRREISYFILFRLNVPFGELFSKNTIKSSAALSFF